MKIDIQTLRLCAAVLRRDPLSLLADFNLDSDTRDEVQRRINDVRGVMPAPLLDSVIDLIEELVNNEGSSFEFVKKRGIPPAESRIIDRWITILGTPDCW